METSKEFRIDNTPIKYYQITPEGFLKFIAPISKRGEMVYFDSKTNSKYTEFVGDECLVKSAKTFRNKPITLHHPPIKLNDNNTTQYIKGALGDKEYYQQDQGLLWFSGSVFDGETIKSVTSKQTKELSSGYDALVRLDDSRREQIDRQGNHVAIVTKARAGEDVSFKIDGLNYAVNFDEFDYEYSSDILQTFEMDSKDIKYVFINANQKDTKEDEKMTVQILLGNKIYNIDGDDAKTLRDDLTSFLVSQQDKLTNADSVHQTSLSEIQTKLDEANNELLTVKNKITELETENTSLKTNNDALDVEKIVSERLETWNRVLPAITRMDAAYKPEFSHSVHQIYLDYLIRKIPALKTKFDAFDLSKESDRSSVENMFIGAFATDSSEAKTVEKKTNTDSIFELLNTSRGVTETTTTNNDSVDYRSQYANAIVSNGIKK